MDAQFVYPGGFNARMFVAAFVTAVYTYYYSDVDPSQRVVNVPTSEIRPEYDFIIVGAGSAGNVLANRLSEVDGWSVLLLEAGGDENAITEAPFLPFLTPGTDLDWNYTTVAQRRACGATGGLCEWPRGRVIGGCSSTNIMYYVRGSPYDYDGWEAMGNPGWSYETILPYFLQAEGTTIPELQDSPWHNTTGPLTTSYARFITPLRDVYEAAGVDLGYYVTDYNTPNQTGFSRAQYTIRGQSRCSTGKAFLNPARNRSNLNVAYRAHVNRVIFDGTRAVGVAFERDGELVTVRARNEVILSAGAINSPQILLLSGVGPEDHLASMGIPLVANLSVGENLQDHLSIGLFYEVNQDVTITERLWNNEQAILDYAQNGSGPLTSPVGWESIAFITVDGNPTTEPPDIQFHIGSYVPSANNTNLFEVWVLTLRPRSRGTIRLNTTNPDDAPLIDPNYFSDTEDYDFQTTASGIRQAFRFTSTSSFAPYAPRFWTEHYTLCADFFNDEDQLVSCLLTEYSFTNFHPAGTCKMGPASDPAAVVGPDLLVHSVTNLRVVDASIMPNITSGNLNAPTIMIAQKAADLIREQWSGRGNSTSS